MTNTICGHERETLRWALELWATVTNGGAVMYSAGTGGAKLARANAFGDANDPAKLAAMLAERGRELGFDVHIHPCGAPDQCPDNAGIEPWMDTPYKSCTATMRIQQWFPDNGAPYIELVILEHFVRRDLSLSQARAILLQWLQLPDGAREEAEKVLRGANGL